MGIDLKSRKLRTRGFLPALWILVALTLCAGILHAQSQSSGGHHRPVQKLILASPPPGFVPPVVASLRFQPGDSKEEYWVKATENPYARETCTTQLTFAVGSATRRRVIFRYKSCDWLMYMLPPDLEAPVLVTVWEGGSSVWVTAFQIKGDKVTKVFDRASHFPPEFTQDAILLDTGWVPVGEQCCTASKTEIWTWTGNNYKLLDTVPFDKRYETLGRLEGQGGRKN